MEDIPVSGKAQRGRFHAHSDGWWSSSDKKVSFQISKGDWGALRRFGFSSSEAKDGVITHVILDPAKKQTPITTVSGIISGATGVKYESVSGYDQSSDGSWCQMLQSRRYLRVFGRR